MNTKSEASCTTDDITRQVEKHVSGEDVRRMSDTCPFCRKSIPLVIRRAVYYCVLSKAYQKKVSNTSSVSP